MIRIQIAHFRHISIYDQPVVPCVLLSKLCQDQLIGRKICPLLVVPSCDCQRILHAHHEHPAHKGWIGGMQTDLALSTQGHGTFWSLQLQQAVLSGAKGLKY